VPGARPKEFAETDRVRVVEPEEGETESQFPPDNVVADAVIDRGLPVLLTDTVWVPDAVNVSAVCETVNVGAVVVSARVMETMEMHKMTAKTRRAR